MRPKPSRALRWLPPLLWMALIFEGSSDLLSAQHTSRFIEPFLRWLFHGSLSMETIDKIHFLIRKAGHLSEYAILGVLFWWTLRSPGWRRAAYALLLAATFAASDEFHQSFVPTREASVRDVLIDTTGATLGLAVLLGSRRALLTPRNQAGTGNVPSPPG